MCKTEIVWIETKKIMKNNFRDNSIENRKIEILEIITNANCLFFEDKRRCSEEKVLCLFKLFYRPFRNTANNPFLGNCVNYN